MKAPCSPFVATLTSQSSRVPHAADTETGAGMNTIGLFSIERFEAVFNAAGGVDRVTGVTLNCGRCDRASTSDDHALVHLPGGTLIRCEYCGTHQAVSNAKIAEWDRQATLEA